MGLKEVETRKKMSKRRAARHRERLYKKGIRKIMGHKMTNSLVHNILHLKAYCLGVHSKIKGMLKAGPLSTLETFLYRFGAHNHKDAIGEYLKLYKYYSRR